MQETNPKVNRRKFLKSAGMGSLALALFPTQKSLSAAFQAGRPQTNFHFLALSGGTVIDDVHHTILMGGHGVITPGNVIGNGSFQHNDPDPAKPIPKPILGEGTWKAKRLESFDVLGTYGDVGVAGVLKMEINLVPSQGPEIPAMLEVVCNIPPAGLFTGKPEGYVLTIPGAPFSPFVPFGPPPRGITWFARNVEPRG